MAEKKKQNNIAQQFKDLFEHLYKNYKSIEKDQLFNIAKQDLKDKKCKDSGKLLNILTKIENNDQEERDSFYAAFYAAFSEYCIKDWKENLFGLLYRIYNSELNDNDQNELFYITKQVLESDSFDEVDKMVKSLDRATGKDQTDFLVQAFLHCLQEGKPHSNSNGFSKLESFVTYVKKYIGERKKHAQKIYYTPRTTINLQEEDVEANQVLEILEKECDDYIKIQALTELGEDVNREIEECLAAINEKIFVLGGMNVEKGEKVFVESLNTSIKPYKLHCLSQAERKIRNFYLSLMRGQEESGREKIFFDLRKKFSEEQILQLMQFAKKDYVSFLNIDEKLLHLLLQDNKELAPFLTFYELSKKGVDAGVADAWKFSTEEAITGMYKFIHSDQCTEEDRKQFKELGLKIRDRFAKQRNKLQGIIDRNHGSFDETRVYLKFQELMKELSFDELAFATNFVEFCQTDLMARSNSSEVYLLSDAWYDTHKMLVESEYRMEKTLKKLATQQLPKEWKDLSKENKELIMQWKKQNKRQKEDNAVHTQILNLQHAINVEQSQKWIRQHYRKFSEGVHKIKQGKFIISREYDSINTHKFWEDFFKKPISECSNIGAGYANIRDYSLGQAKQVPLQDQNGDPVLDENGKQVMTDKKIDGLIVHKGENVPCVVMGILIENKYLNLPGDNDVFIHISKEIGNDTGLYNIEFSLVPQGDIEQRIQIARLENTNGVVPHGNREDGDNVGQKITIPSTTHWHWYNKQDRVFDGSEKGHYIISENYVGSHFPFEEALDVFFEKTKIDPSHSDNKDNQKARKTMKKFILSIISALEKDILDSVGLGEGEEKKQRLIKIIKDRRNALGNPINFLKKMKKGDLEYTDDELQDMSENQDI